MSELEVIESLNRVWKRIEAKLGLAEKRSNKLLEQQNEILKELLDFLKHGPEFEVEEFGSAEEDHIEDSMELTNEEELAIKEIQDDWRESGYSDDLDALVSRR